MQRGGCNAIRRCPARDPDKPFILAWGNGVTSKYGCKFRLLAGPLLCGVYGPLTTRTRASRTSAAEALPKACLAPRCHRPWCVWVTVDGKSAMEQTVTLTPRIHTIGAPTTPTSWVSRCVLLISSAAILHGRRPLRSRPFTAQLIASCRPTTACAKFATPCAEADPTPPVGHTESGARAVAPPSTATAAHTYGRGNRYEETLMLACASNRNVEH